MNIEKYSFGKIVIDGKKYTSDLIIFPDHIKANWLRERGHFLQLEDLEEVIAFKPEIVIIGTGAFGVMKISDKVIEKMKELNIEFRAEKTGEAVKLFNAEVTHKNVVAGLHLTC